jgi:hypothetical protein
MIACTLNGVSFEDQPAVEAELRALVAAENECCSWAAWTVAREDGALVVAASSRREGIATLHAMFTTKPFRPVRP